mgnify:CR=1 FL=1
MWLTISTGNKLQLDKYYTPLELAKHCIDKTYEVIGGDSISEVIEPSAGNGSFSLQMPSTCRAYDIKPEHESIIEQDFLELDADYLYGRLIIGNPPYGSRMNMAQKFFKKSIEISDYIAFILPISQLNNTNSLYEFDLIHSEDLGLHTYTDRELHCCFNIYKRPENGEFNKKPKTRLKDITIIRQDSKRYDEITEDIRMCYWGDGTAGKILSDGESYSGEYKIIINNQDRHAEIKSFILDFDRNGYVKGIAMKRLKQYQIIDVLQKNIKGIN